MKLNETIRALEQPESPPGDSLRERCQEWLRQFVMSHGIVGARLPSSDELIAFVQSERANWERKVILCGCSECVDEYIQSELAPLRELVAKWRTRITESSCVFVWLELERIRDCADELQAALDRMEKP